MGADHLYIVGNGFDRYHGAKSTYRDFRSYLARRNRMCANFFELFFGPRSLFNNFSNTGDILLALSPDNRAPYPRKTWADTTLWADFERYLGQLDREKVFDYVDLMLPEADPDDDEFIYADYYAPISSVSEMVRECTFDMQYHFHRWINTLSYPRGFKPKMISLDPDALYLNFNYTLFLEEHYHISQKNICYIHGDRRQRFGSLVLGHSSTDPDADFRRWRHQHILRKRYRPNLKDRSGRYFANDKLVYLAYFHDDETQGMGNYLTRTRYYAIEETLSALEEYFDHNIKRCDDIIRRHSDFFDSLAGVRLITVLGHSLSDVDIPYFREILRHIPDREAVKWQFSCHTDRDRDNITRFCKQFGISSESNVRSLHEISDFIGDLTGLHSRRQYLMRDESTLPEP